MPKNSVIIRNCPLIQFSPKLGKPKTSARGTKDKAVSDWKMPESTEKASRVTDCSGASFKNLKTVLNKSTHFRLF